jgi:dienelactone hydrolase
VRWYRHAAPDGAHVLVGIVRGPPSASGRPGVLLVPGTEGLNVDYDTFAHQLAGLGFDVAIGCWFAAAPTTPASPLIGCAGGPKFKGVTEPAVADLDALVDAAKPGLHTERIAVAGFSRGGGIALLRASHGTTEPVISIAGMAEGWSNLGAIWGEVNVVQRANGIHTPVLLLHGDNDGAVPVSQAHHMQAALQHNGVPVEAKYYPGAGHGLAADPATRHDMILRIARFVCERLGCPSPGEAP